MKKYFGTDGIRQKAEKFTPEFLQKVVWGLKNYLSKEDEIIRVLIGGDTRESSEWILRELELALESLGMECDNVGVLPTPGINAVFYELGYDLAIDVTASHNPYLDNGIKIFERGEKFGLNYGVKLSEEGVSQVEQALESDFAMEVKSVELKEDLHDEGLSRYLKHLEDYLQKIGPRDTEKRKPVNFQGLKIGLDLANGAVSAVSGRLFEKLGAEVVVINDNANYGRGINQDCGSTNLESLKNLVVKEGLNFGIAYDGDGDRCLMIDEKGDEVDGDQIMAIIADYLKLPAMVVTVMANLGLMKWAKQYEIDLEVTDVGDQNVAERMRKKKILLGGEQCGHIVLPGQAMGDGMLTSLVMTKIMTEKGLSLSEVSSLMQKLPQVNLAVPISDEGKKALKSESLQKLVAKEAEILEQREWKLLVRPSGTEGLMRVTIWGDDLEKIKTAAEQIAEKIKEQAEKTAGKA